MSARSSLQRDALADTVLQSAFHKDDIRDDNILLVEIYDKNTQAFFDQMAKSVSVWNRRYSKNITPTTAPPKNTYQHIIIRLPKSHAALTMILEMTLPYLAPMGHLTLYGMTDEGIKGAKKKLRTYFHHGETLLFKKRCHVFSARNIKNPLPKKSLHDFAQHTILQYHRENYPVTFYPGMFAYGTLDHGTTLLLDMLLPQVKDTRTILDFGCGSGIIGSVLFKKCHAISYTGLDNDCIALDACKKTLHDYTKATYLLSENLHPAQSYDMIVSNPPMHTEKEEHISTILTLIATAPQHLTATGSLVMVTQSRLQLAPSFTRHFRQHTILKATPQFTVWQGFV